MSILIAFLAAVQSARATCPSDATALREGIATAASAFDAMDALHFDAALLALDADLACVQAAIDPALARDLHDLRARAAFLARQPEAARQAFRAALAADPDFTLPATLAPAGHPLARILDEARAIGPGATTPIDVAAPRRLIVDGAAADALPTDREAYLQGVEEDRVEWTFLGTSLSADQRAWLAQAPDAVSSTTTLPSTTPRRQRTATTGAGPGLPLAVSAGTAAVASGALLGLALSSKATFLDPQTPYEDLDALNRRTATLSLASEGAAGLAVGLGIAAAVTWRR